MHTFDTDLDLYIDGTGVSFPASCVVSYDYEPATGDGWHEPRYDSRVILCSVEAQFGSTKVDLLPLIDATRRALLEDVLLQDHEEGIQAALDEARIDNYRMEAA